MAPVEEEEDVGRVVPPPVTLLALVSPMLLDVDVSELVAALPPVDGSLKRPFSGGVEVDFEPDARSRSS